MKSHVNSSQTESGPLYNWPVVEHTPLVLKECTGNILHSNSLGFPIVCAQHSRAHLGGASLGPGSSSGEVSRNEAKK
jgi:hypothetical protein